jgi:hypothetical protein
MTSDETVHIATCIDTHLGTWSLSWLPGRMLTRNQAVTGMTLAEAVGKIQTEGAALDHTHRMWPFIENWAGELDLFAPEAVVRVLEPREGQP